MATIKNIILVVFIMAGVGIGIFTFAGESLENYGKSLESNFSNTEANLRKTLSDTSNFTEVMQTELGKSGGIDVQGGFAILKGSTLAVIKLPFQAISLSATLLTDLMNLYPIPSWVFTLTIGIVMLLLVMAIFSVILRKDI